MKKINKIISMLLSVILVCSLIPVSQASAKEIKNFPLKTSAGKLVADETTKFITVFEQDPVSKVITATVQIQQGDTEAIQIELVGISIFFDKARVAPYSKKAEEPAVFTGRLDTETKDYDKKFEKFYDVPTGFTTESNQIIVRDMQNSGDGFISIMLNRPSNDISGLPDPKIIEADGKADIAKFYFMPVNDNDKDLDLNMFNYGYYKDETTLIRAVNFFGCASSTVEVTKTDLKLSYSDSIINQSSFKLHVQHLQPVVAANNDTRQIDDYNTATMEWSYDGVEFTGGTPVVKDEAHTIYVRTKGDNTYSSAGTNTYYTENYKKYVAGAPAAVSFNASSCKGKIELTKISDNVTSTDGKTHVKDEIKYTITVTNTATHPSSVWVNAVMTDKLPEGVDFKGEVTLNNANLSTPGGYTFANGTLTVPLGNIPGGASKTVTFIVTVRSDAYGKDITNHVSVAGKDGEDGEEFNEEADEEGGNHIVVEKSDAPTLNPITEGDTKVSGEGVPGASITVTVTTPGDSSINITVEVDNDGKWTAALPDGGEFSEGDVVTAVQTEEGKDPSDPVEKTVAERPNADNEATKTAKNITTNDDSVRRVGDTLQYTITATNKGPAKSLWANVTIVDALPEEVDFKGNVKIGNDAAGTNAVYDAGTHTLTVNLGGILGGTSKVVTFEVVINDKAYSKSFKNTATVGGIDIEEPGDPPTVVRRSDKPTIDEVNDGDRIIEGTGVVGAKIVVSFQDSTLTANATVGADGKWKVNVPDRINLFVGDVVKAVQTEDGFDPSEPAEAIVQNKVSVVPYMTKTSENKTSEDDKIHVNDVIEYTIVVGNRALKSVWKNVIFTDALPNGVTYVNGSFTTKDTGLTSTHANGVLTVMLGDISGGEAKTFTFKVTVDPDAYGKDIRNSASVTGKDNGGDDKDTETEEEGEDLTVTEKSDDPTVDEITRGDDKISGGGIPGSDIIVKLPDGTEIKTTVNNGGSWTADLPSGKGLDTGEKIYVTQTEKGKDPSDAVEKTVNDKPYRAIHGYVWPIVSEGAADFIEKHEIVVELRANANTPAEVLKTIAVTVESMKNDDIGEFTIENIPFGEYILYIKRPGYLPRCMSVKIPSGNSDMIELKPLLPDAPDAPDYPDDEEIFKLWWGDSNGDFRVDGIDIAMILEKLNTSANSPEYDPDCDLNADGRIDGRDIALATGNVNKHAKHYAGAKKIDFDAEPIKKP